jgi:hypothetical protein
MRVLLRDCTHFLPVWRSMSMHYLPSAHASASSQHEQQSSAPSAARVPRARECFAAGFASMRQGVRLVRRELEQAGATRTLVKAQHLAERAQRKLAEIEHEQATQSASPR